MSKQTKPPAAPPEGPTTGETPPEVLTAGETPPEALTATATDQPTQPMPAAPPEGPTTGETPPEVLTAGETPPEALTATATDQPTQPMPAAPPEPEAKAKPVIVRISGTILKRIHEAQSIGDLRAATEGLKPAQVEGLQGPIYEARRRIVAAGIK